MTPGEGYGGSVLLLAEADTKGRTPEQYERWYLTSRIPEVVTAGGYRRGTLFARSDAVGTARPQLPGRYLAIFETDQPASVDRVALVAGPELAGGGGRYAAEFDRLVEYRAAPAAPDLRTVTGVHVVMVNNTAEDRDADFNAWYNDVHLADVVAAAHYRAGTRYMNSAAGPGDARYLALYQSDWPDPREGRALVTAAAGGMRLWPRLEQVHVAVYDRVG